MHTVHNARITLLATAFNNLALSVVVAGFIAPQPPGSARRQASRATLALDHLRNALTAGKSCSGGCGSDQAWVWLIWPAILTGALCVGGIWAARYIP